MKTSHGGIGRRQLLKVAAALGATGLAFDVEAQGDRPLRLILPNAAGSGVDAITRAMQSAFAKAVGRPVIVDNQPGAGGIVGLQVLARSAPDGNTLGIVSNNVVIFPSLYKSLPFNMPGDFTPIAICGYTPMVLVVNPATGVGNAKEFIALLKAKPNELTFGSGGNGTILHLASEMFLEEVGAKARHIPYRGVGPMVTDLIAGQVNFATAALPSVQPYLKSGALRAIGVTTAERVPAAPNIPTFVEQNVPGYVIDAWFAAIGPKGLPAADALHFRDALAAAFAASEVKETMALQGNIIQVGTPENAQKFFVSEMARYAVLVKKAGIQLE
jgi:tripartite-type tricarboxylate transporter receptor subunit TctC